MKPGEHDNRTGLLVRMSCGERLLSRGLRPARSIRWAVLLALVLCCWAVLVLPVAADDLPDGLPGAPTDIPTDIPTSLPTGLPTAIPTAVPTAILTSVPTATPTPVPSSAPGDGTDNASGPHSTATLRISASISQGIGLDVEAVEDEDVEVREETYTDENGTTRIKTVVSLGDMAVDPPEVAVSTQKESDLNVVVSSNYDTSWQLQVSSSNDGYMVASEDQMLRMQNPFYFLQEQNNPLFHYVQPDAALRLPDLNDDPMLLLRGNRSITNIPIPFGTRQEVTWDDMLQAERYWITLYFGVGPN